MLSVAAHLALPLVYGFSAVGTIPAPLYGFFLFDSPHVPDFNTFASQNAYASVATIPLTFAGAALGTAIAGPVSVFAVAPLGHMVWTYGSLSYFWKIDNFFGSTLPTAVNTTKQAIDVAGSAVAKAVDVIVPGQVQQTETPCSFTTAALEDDFLQLDIPNVPTDDADADDDDDFVRL
jgi:hypothetical protein